MTLIMAWSAPADNGVWIVSDSRLSAPGEAGGRVRLTDSAAKLLDLQQRRLDAYTVPPRDVLERGNLGFAYAGSSLVALQAHAAVSPLWANLLGDALPTIRESAEHLAVFLAYYFREVSAATGSADTECLLVGADPGTGRIDACYLRPQLVEGQIDCIVQDIDLSADLFAMGSQRRSVETIQRFGAAWHREPINWIRSWLADVPDDDDVGGGVQIGWVTFNGFAHLQDIRPVEVGKPAARAFFRGIDFDKINVVGRCFCGLPGLT